MSIFVIGLIAIFVIAVVVMLYQDFMDAHQTQTRILSYLNTASIGAPQYDAIINCGFFNIPAVKRTIYDNISANFKTLSTDELMTEQSKQSQIEIGAIRVAAEQIDRYFVPVAGATIATIDCSGSYRAFMNKIAAKYPPINIQSVRIKLLYAILFNKNIYSQIGTMPVDEIAKQVAAAASKMVASWSG